MSKLRINPRGNVSRNNPNKSNNSDKDKLPTNTSSKSVKVDIQFFLDKKDADFTKEDLESFQEANKARIVEFFDDSNRIITKLFKITRLHLEKNKVVKEILIKDDSLKTVSALPNNFKELEPLITEIIEDNTEESKTFITTLINTLEVVDYELKNEPLNIEKLYNSLSVMLQKLQNYNITQQKYIYRSLANLINQNQKNYTFISPEDGSFIDPRFHKIVSGSGQRILRGLSYVLLDSTNDELLKFGQIKTI
jgi:hypothetical protein